MRAERGGKQTNKTRCGFWLWCFEADQSDFEQFQQKARFIAPFAELRTAMKASKFCRL